MYQSVEINFNYSIIITLKKSETMSDIKITPTGKETKKALT